MFKSVLIAVSSAVVVVATGYVSLIALIVATSMQKQKGYLMEQTNKKQKKLFIIYKTLLSILEKCKGSQSLAKFSIDVEKQLKEFEEEYPEVVSEYYFKHRP